MLLTGVAHESRQILSDQLLQQPLWMQQHTFHHGAAGDPNLSELWWRKKCRGGIWRLHTVIVRAPSHDHSPSSSCFCSDINFKVYDMLLCFLKKIIIHLFWPLISFIWEAFKSVQAQAPHFNSLSLQRNIIFRWNIYSCCIHVSFCFSPLESQSTTFSKHHSFESKKGPICVWCVSNEPLKNLGDQKKQTNQKVIGLIHLYDDATVI